jgi:tetratricopeptide (TPR) repeat protein
MSASSDTLPETLAGQLAAVRASLRTDPDNSAAHYHFGTLLSEFNDLPAGEWHFRRSLALGGARPEVLMSLGLNLMQQGRLDEADRCYREAHALAPADVRILAYHAKLHEVRGQLDEAAALLDRAEAAGSPRDVDLLRAGVLARAGRPADALAIIDAAPSLGGDAQLERGRLCERLGRYDEAWRDFVAGKRKLAAAGGELAYHAHAVEAFFDRLGRAFTRDAFARLPRTTARSDVPQPIFVIGLPRSGTTLVEQVLASHPRVRAGGELSFIGEFRKLALALLPGKEPFPENLAFARTADLRYLATLLRDYYLARAAGYGLGEGPRWFVDKMPFNEIWLPLIRMAFPDSPIVQVVRHPLDVAVSMLANHLTHGFHCGYRIEDIVHHVGAVHALVARYDRELGSARLMLRYEHFVADQESETRRLLDHAGLPFDAACLRFHENPRYAPTPSYAQVTERLHDRSIGRHRHYAAQLAPHGAQLRGMLHDLGYDQNFTRTPAK